MENVLHRPTLSLASLATASAASFLRGVIFSVILISVKTKAEIAPWLQLHQVGSGQTIGQMESAGIFPAQFVNEAGLMVIALSVEKSVIETSSDKDREIFLIESAGNKKGLQFRPSFSDFEGRECSFFSRQKRLANIPWIADCAVANWLTQRFLLLSDLSVVTSSRCFDKRQKIDNWQNIECGFVTYIGETNFEGNFSTFVKRIGKSPVYFYFYGNPSTIIELAGFQRGAQRLLGFSQGKILKVGNNSGGRSSQDNSESSPYYRITKGAFLFLCCGFLSMFGIVRIYNLHQASGEETYNARDSEKRHAAISAVVLILGWFSRCLWHSPYFAGHK